MSELGKWNSELHGLNLELKPQRAEWRQQRQRHQRMSPGTVAFPWSELQNLNILGGKDGHVTPCSAAFSQSFELCHVHWAYFRTF